MKRFQTIPTLNPVRLIGLLILSASALMAQDRIISRGVKWLRVGNLHSTFAIEGAEFEMHRTGNLPEQSDGMRWPAQFRWQDCTAAKSMWVGVTDWEDPVSDRTYKHKVVCVGPRQVFPDTEIMPYFFEMYGRFPAPLVTVDGLTATANRLNDILEDIRPELKADRMIVNKMRTAIGLDVTRRLMAFSQQNHDNYFIYEYVLTNTGIIDLEGTTINRTLKDLVFHLQFRYAPANESFKRGWGLSGVSWGRNTVNHVIGTDPAAPDFEMRAFYSWYGPFSSAPTDDWGSPDPARTGVLGAAQYPGVVTLHADRSVTDFSDDPYQPRCTWYVGSDQGPQAINQYDPQLMTRKYTTAMAVYDPDKGQGPMDDGHPAKTHAEEVGDGYANLWTTDAGGISQGVGYGPYTLAPGDSIRIVVAEGVGGIGRARNLEVGRNWINVAVLNQAPATPMIMPDGTVLSNPSVAQANDYKKAWVKTGADSIRKAFRHAIRNFESGYDIPQPPPPPSEFTVRSGGDRIILSWADNAVSWNKFDGYEVYRAIDKPDTFYTKIFSCNRGNAVHTYEDTTARRGFNYFYYVVSKDDGSANDIRPGVPLVSSRFYTMTNQPAFLRRPAEDRLEEIRVVPNPFHIRAQELQFGVETPDRIAFFGLPPKCTIRIYTERGDLIKTIHHTDQTGDELWDCTTESKQIIVSGLYIAHFEITEDTYDSETGAMLFRKGQQTFRKFIVIR
ncbi:MAG TPA: hypothetical protein ENN17_06730 [bacterium]|nr:hypothetical protein [bacterium]